MTGTVTSWGVAKQIPVGTVSVGETNVTVPSEYCTVNSRKVTAFNATVLDVDIATTAVRQPGARGELDEHHHRTNTVTCTSKLKLVKQVVNDNGGTATAANWTLLHGSTGVTSGTTSVVTPGAYVLTETGLAGSAGYAPSATNPLSCTTGLSGTTVTVPIATTVTCTFTNDDIAPTLTLVKTVQGADGVPATNWTLTAKEGDHDRGHRRRAPRPGTSRRTPPTRSRSRRASAAPATSRAARGAVRRTAAPRSP